MPITLIHNRRRRALRHRLQFSLPIALILAGLFALPVQASTCIPLPPYASEADRIGFNFIIRSSGKSILNYNVDPLNAGWYIDYRPEPYLNTASLFAEAANPDDPALSGQNNSIFLPQIASAQPEFLVNHNLAHMPVIRIGDLTDAGWEGYVSRLVQKKPGNLWVIGNEMDRLGQDGLRPDEYAVIYHDTYKLIKQTDPSAQVAIGAMVQPTPLRRRYLELVMEEYQRRYSARMPVDVWNIHAFILREDYTWGAGIPPGMDAYAHLGTLYEVPDHGDIEILKRLVRDFRTWMAQRGYRNTPLIISEYGILMAPDYDAGNGRVYDSAFVKEYMLASFEFFRAAANAQTGYPSDGNRLVQSWAWYSLNDYVYVPDVQEDGFNGNLLDHDSSVITPVGKAFAEYAGRYSLDYLDLALHRINVSQTSIPAGTEGIALTVNASFLNRGNLAANRARLRFWLGEPGSGTLLAEKPLTEPVPIRCRAPVSATVRLRLPALPVGFHHLVVEVVDAARTDAIPGNERAAFTLRVGDASDFDTLFVPIIAR